MYPNPTTEASVLHAVIEDREGDAAEKLAKGFRDEELIGFLDALGKTMDLVNAELTARGIRA